MIEVKAYRNEQTGEDNQISKPVGRGFKSLRAHLYNRDHITLMVEFLGAEIQAGSPAVVFGAIGIILAIALLLLIIAIQKED